jgi:hypothetical protein
MGYSNINATPNYQLQGFGQSGMRTISTSQAYVEGEYYRVLVATQDSTISATSVIGDNITSLQVYAGTTIYGLFTAVSVSVGEVTAYLAGATDIESVWSYINTYGLNNGAIIEAADCAKDAIEPLLDKYYAQASLVLVPSLYKTSVVYAERPLDANGQLTFTRASEATRVGPDGYIEKVRTNLVLQSQTFDNASWTKDALSVTANSETAPDGTTTAETITADGTAATHGIRQNGTATLTNGITYSTSIYAKKGTNDFIQIVGSTAPYITTNVFANFDLNNGVVGTVGSLSTGKIESVGNGWYRCTLIAAAAATSSTNTFIVQLVSSASAVRGESNSLSTSVYVWAAQLETGDIATNYIPTTTTAVSVGPVSNLPRLDYPINADGSVGCPSLLLEPQRTNLYLFSEQLNQWTAIGTPTITSNYAVSPEGYSNADRIQFAPGNALFRSGTGSAGSNTLSVYAKATNGVSADFRFFGNGATIFSSNQTATGEWQRFTYTYTFASVTAGLAAPTTGGGVSDVIFYGFQHEIGAYATSYIPTLGASVTRVADICNKTGISSLIGQTEGTLFVDMVKSQSGYNYYNLSDGTNNNRIFIGQDADNPDRLRAYVRVSGGTASVDINVGPVANGRYKMAIGYKLNDVVFYINGTLSGTDTSTAMPTGLSDFSLTNGTSDVCTLTNNVNQALLFPTRLTNAQMQELTSL